jgi:putative intracellular protease/amidase
MATMARGEATPAPTATARPAAYDPAKPTAVVVVGSHGAEVSDVLVPYEVLAATGRFNVYTVAPTASAVPLNADLDLVPDLTFAQLDTRLGGRAPTLVVVPAIPDLGKPTTAPLTAWLRTESARGALLESVCNGSGVLASAGLLDGRPATHTAFESANPTVHWIHGPRWIDDGDIVSAAGVLSGIDATLHVVDRLSGPRAATEAAAAVGWPYYAPGRSLPTVITGSKPSDTVVMFNTAFGWSKPRIGVVLTPNLGEIELASVFDTYGGDSAAAHLQAVTIDGNPIRTRHGLTFLPQASLAAAAPHLDRVIVPGSAAARAASVPVANGLVPDYIHTHPGFAYDAAVTDLAATTDVATARWAARPMELPSDKITFTGPRWPWLPTTQVIGLSLLGYAALYTSRQIRRTRAHRRLDSTSGRPAQLRSTT